jgi:hypothetical protein
VHGSDRVPDPVRTDRSAAPHGHATPQAAISRKLDPAKQTAFNMTYGYQLNQLAAHEAVIFADAGASHSRGALSWLLGAKRGAGCDGSGWHCTDILLSAFKDAMLNFLRNDVPRNWRIYCDEGPDDSGSSIQKYRIIA